MLPKSGTDNIIRFVTYDNKNRINVQPAKITLLTKNEKSVEYDGAGPADALAYYVPDIAERLALRLQGQPEPLSLAHLESQRILQRIVDGTKPGEGNRNNLMCCLGLAAWAEPEDFENARKLIAQKKLPEAKHTQALRLLAVLEASPQTKMLMEKAINAPHGRLRVEARECSDMADRLLAAYSVVLYPPKEEAPDPSAAPRPSLDVEDISTGNSSGRRESSYSPECAIK